MRIVSDTEAAYIAGLWDADGWFQFREGVMKTRIMIAIKMTHRPTIEWLAARLGERITHIKAKHERHKDAYQIGLRVSKHKAFCERILPFMITKRAQAWRVLEEIRKAEDYDARRRHYRGT